MTEKELRREARMTIENTIDEILFYMTEYKEDIAPKKIAEIFTEEYTKIIRQIAEEITENEDQRLTKLNPYVKIIIERIEQQSKMDYFFYTCAGRPLLVRTLRGGAKFHYTTPKQSLSRLILIFLII